MFTFNFTFHVPNPFSITTLTSMANAATDAFNSVATDIREDPELLNYMVAGIGPGGVSSGFGYDSNRLVKSPSTVASSSTHTSPKSKGLKSPRSRHSVGLGLANAHGRNRRRGLPADPQLRGSTSGFAGFGSPSPGSGTPRFPTQAYSQPNPYSNPDVNGSAGQGVWNRLEDPFLASKKRGWAPPSSEPSYASTNEDFTTGLFDTPTFNEMGGPSHDGRATGDRRKWGEGEDENAMEAGEFAASPSPLSVCCSIGVCAPPRILTCSFPELRPIHSLVWGCVMVANVYDGPPSLPSSPSSPPFPRIRSPVRMSEPLTALAALLFSLFPTFIYVQFAMLYHSHFRPGIDALFAVKIELPPAKRRKGLAGSIVSTALSAALIGTAVGLTVYRL